MGSRAALGCWYLLMYGRILDMIWCCGFPGLAHKLALYEAAQIDGAGSIRRFTQITLPNLMPVFFTTTVLFRC